jgi:O-antigen ligase
VNTRSRSSLPIMASKVVLTTLFICIPLALCPSFGPISAVGLMTVFVFALLLLALFDVPKSGLRVSMPLMMFVGWNACFLLRSVPTIEIAQQTIEVTIMPLIVAVICSACQRSPSLVAVVYRTIIWASIFDALLVSTMMVLSVHYDPALVRVFATFAINGVACAAMLGRYYNTRYYVAALFITLAIAVGLSRTCTAIAVVILFIALTFGRSWRRLVIGLGYLVLLYCLWTYYVFPLPAVKNRLSYGDQAFFIGSVPISSEGRMPLWHALLRDWSYSPLLGYGIASARDASLSNGGLDHPHNDYIRVLYEYGLVGFAFWMFGIGALILRYSRSWWRLETLKNQQAFLPGAALLAWVAFCAVMVTDNPMVYYYSVVPLGCILGAAGAEGRFAWPYVLAANKSSLRSNGLSTSSRLRVDVSQTNRCRT